MAWKWRLMAVVCLAVVATALGMATQEVEPDRSGLGGGGVLVSRQLRARQQQQQQQQGGSISWSSRGGGGISWTRGTGSTDDVVGTTAVAADESTNRRLTRLERRRLREERRQARLEIREERRRQKHDSRRSGSSSSSSSSSSGAEVSAAVAGGSSETSRQEHTATGTETAIVSGDQARPEVVDLAWLRANLSSLWREFRAFTSRSQQQHHHVGRTHGRAHQASVLPATLDEEDEDRTSCPSGVDSCRGEDGHVCSGHGECSCGHCRCHWDHYGSYCQCSDHICQVYEGMLCGGPSRGQCRCGECMCRQGFRGEACECPTATSTCVQPGQEGSSLCSSKGTCHCGRCRCEDGYKGMYCEDTVYAAGVCEKLRSCVLCQAWRRELLSCDHCQVSLQMVDSLEPSMTTCVMVNAGCIMKYSYEAHHNNSYTVRLQRNLDCPPQIE